MPSAPAKVTDQVSVSLEPDLLATLDECRAEYGLSRSELIRMCVRDAFPRVARRLARRIEQAA